MSVFEEYVDGKYFAHYTFATTAVFGWMWLHAHS